MSRPPAGDLAAVEVRFVQRRPSPGPDLDVVTYLAAVPRIAEAVILDGQAFRVRAVVWRIDRPVDGPVMPQALVYFDEGGGG